MAQFFETIYKVLSGIKMTQNLWTTILQHIDLRIHALEALHPNGAHPKIPDNFVGSPVAVPFASQIAGVEMNDAHVHFQLQVSTVADFATTEIDVESKSSQTNWTYFDGTVWAAVPAGGVEAWIDYQNALQGYVGYAVLYNTTVAEDLSYATPYYWRMREWYVEGGEYSSSWRSGFFRA